MTSPHNTLGVRVEVCEGVGEGAVCGKDGVGCGGGGVGRVEFPTSRLYPNCLSSLIVDYP